MQMTNEDMYNIILYAGGNLVQQLSSYTDPILEIPKQYRSHQKYDFQTPSDLNSLSTLGIVLIIVTTLSMLNRKIRHW
jgi:hypothetical protein